MSTRQYFITTFFLLAACIGTWLLLTAIENRSVPLNNNDRPDSYMLNVTATSLDENGNLKDELQAPKLVHFAKGDTTNVTKPHFILYNADATGQPWHVYADQGQARDGINVLDLWGNVRLEQPAGPDNAAITMVTSAITVFPKEQYAQTQQPVKVWQSGSVATSVGMRINLKTGNIELLSQAKGKYQPNSQ